MARLLIIEDGVALASLLVSATSERGHLTSAYHAGSPGLQAASEERFDLAIVDLLLPDLRGAEVLERLRDLGVPTLAMSGVFKGERFARDAVERHGARAFFEKPFALDRLLDAIDAEVLRGEAQAATASGDHRSDTEPEDDAEAIELDFDLEVDVPTAEIHLDHPTTELELNPEALEAFQEALEHSASPTAREGNPGHEGDGASQETALGQAGQDAAAPVDAEDAETSFAGMLDDEPATPVDSAGARPEGAGEATPASDDEITAPSPLRADDQSGHDAGLTDDRVTAPTRASSAVVGAGEVAPGGEGPADASASGAWGHAAGDAPDDRAASSDPDGEAELIVLQSDDIREDADAAGSGEKPAGRAQPSDEEGHPDAGEASHDAQGADAQSELSFAAIFDAEETPGSPATDAGRPEIPPEVSEHIDHSFEQAVQPHGGGAPHTPFSERAAVWEGEPNSPTSRARVTPPPEASLGEHGLYALLNACHQSRFTGTLNVEGDSQRILTLVDGQLASIRDPADPAPLPSMAELSVREGHIDEELLEEVRELAGHEGLSEDEAVVLMGLMTPEQLSTRTREHLRPLLIELLGWTDGRLHLTAGARDGDGPSSSRAPLAALIFEAILERGGDDTIAAELPGDLQLAPTEDPPYELGEIPLSGPQAQLLAHSDGSKSVSDLALLSDLEAEDVRLTLWALVRLGILAPLNPTRSTRRITFGL